MQYNATIVLKDGRTCVIRHGRLADGAEALRSFKLCH